METNDRKLKEIIVRGVTETIENMAFMEVLPVEEGLTDQIDDTAIRAALLVLEPKQGELRLMMPPVTATALACALYNIADTEITEGMLNDVTGELLNMIAGKVMKQVLPAESTFQLGLPEIGPDAFLKTESVFVQCSFTIDGSPCIIMGCMELIE